MYIKKILFLIAFLIVIAGGLFSYYIYNQVLGSNTAFQSQSVSLYISKKDTPKDVLHKITPLLKDIRSFDWLAKKKAYYKYIKPGHYIIKKGDNNNEIITTLRSKNTPVTVSFNNQERIEDLAGRIAQQIDVDSLELLVSFTDKIFLKKHHFTKENALSMYLPNSYQLFWNTTPDKFRNRMFKEYKRFWNKNRELQAKKIGLTPNNVYTLASIVHKETVKIDERSRIAGVYMNRINKGIKLDADPTVIFAIKKESNNWGKIIKRVLFKDLKVENPYNTYKNNGLPPGPIAMPDISAINAVLNYEHHNYYYFVADTQRLGYHKFASSLAQHNRNSKSYHAWVNKKGLRR